MTMHLVGPYLTSTNYRKRKDKVTQVQMAKWQSEYKERCKFNKRLGLPKETFEQYLDVIHGRVKKEHKFVPMKQQADPVMDRIRRQREQYPSAIGSGAAASTAKKEPQRYTGERRLLGIAVMHKSNLVPIFDQKDAEEIARMRR